MLEGQCLAAEGLEIQQTLTVTHHGHPLRRGLQAQDFAT